MSYSKLIHEYLDRQLNGANEDALFSELARDPDLRVEFNQQVQIQSVASSDMAMISPPAESTNSIFSSLNFSIPSSEFLNRIPYDVAKLSNGYGLVNLFKKHLTTIMAVLITAGLTTAVFEFTGFNTNNANINVAQKQLVPLVSSVENNILANNQSVIAKQLKKNTIVSASHRKHSRNFIANNSLKENSDIKTATNDILSMSSSVNSSNTNLSSIAKSQNAGFSSVSSIQYEPFMSDFVPQNNFSDGDLALIAGFSNSNSAIKVNLPDGKFYQNFNLSALYKVRDNWYFGVQIGQEQMPQDFKRNLFGQGLSYQQNFAFLYYGAVAKYSHPISILGDYSRYVSAYGQIFGGSTRYGGVLSRLQIGLSFSPYSLWTFNIGYEFINYNYYVDNSWNQTNKNGLTFGTGISF